VLLLTGICTEYHRLVREFTIQIKRMSDKLVQLGGPSALESFERESGMLVALDRDMAQLINFEMQVNAGYTVLYDSQESRIKNAILRLVQVDMLCALV
jgi:hypothetical protein